MQKTDSWENRVSESDRLQCVHYIFFTSSQDENQSPTAFMWWLHILDIQSRFKTHLKEDCPPFLLLVEWHVE